MVYMVLHNPNILPRNNQLSPWRYISQPCQIQQFQSEIEWQFAWTMWKRNCMAMQLDYTTSIVTRNSATCVLANQNGKLSQQEKQYSKNRLWQSISNVKSTVEWSFQLTWTVGVESARQQKRMCIEIHAIEWMLEMPWRRSTIDTS